MVNVPAAESKPSSYPAVCLQFVSLLRQSVLHQQKLMFSPLVLNIVDNLVHSTLMFNSEPSRGEGFIWQRPIDLNFSLLIVFCCLLTVASIFYLGKKAKLDDKTHKFWLLIALITGPTALIAFLILMPWPKLQGLITRESAA